MEITENKKIGELVSYDYRTAAVFEKFGIDFYCKSNKSLADVCKKNESYKNLLIQDLKKAVYVYENKSFNFNYWPIDLLANYIEKKHHRYALSNIPALNSHIEQSCKQDANTNLHITEIRQLFHALSIELCDHMYKEEHLLFPYIREMVSAKQKHTPLKKPEFDSINRLVNGFMLEHEEENEIFLKLAKLSNNYTYPESAGSAYRCAISSLREFAVDFHMHTHLETNILFPKATEMENQLER